MFCVFKVVVLVWNFGLLCCRGWVGGGEGEMGLGKELTLVTVGNCALTGNCKAIDRRHSTKHCSHWKVCFSQRYRLAILKLLSV